MQTTPDSWRGPGSTGGSAAPNTFWVTNQNVGTSWSMRVQAFDNVGALKVVSTLQLILWDQTSGTNINVATFNNVNTINISSNMNTNGHVYTYKFACVGATTADHCVCSTTAIDATAGFWKNYPVLRTRRSGVWNEVGGPGIRVRRSGAWVPVNGGIFVRRSSAWTAL